MPCRGAFLEDEFPDRARRGTDPEGLGAAVLDVNLNGRLSFPIGEAIRQRGIRVVFATGYDPQDRASCGLDGAM